ncbi:MAG TPA: hypothetical protein VE398_02220 [Acidobacteriota bacterium]|nr:hypothetical protein [Acidobacteriota bacterium]
MRFRHREAEWARIKAQSGYDITDIAGVRTVDRIRIGNWELPRIPWRALRELRIE